MQLISSKKLQTFIQMLCIACIIAMITISFTVYHASVTNFIAFLSFIVFFVQLPGNAILHFSKIKTKHLSETALLGLFTGWALIVLEYFICDLLHTSVIYYANLFLVIIFLLSVLKNKARNPLKSIPNIPASLCLCIVITLLYALLLTQFRYLAPGTSSVVFSTSDKSFQMGIINALVKDFPAANPWVDGMTIHYHLFSQVLYAVSIIIFPSLSSNFIVMSCGPYLLTYTLCTSFYALFKRFCKNGERAGLYTLLVILSHPFLAKTPIKSYIFRILLVNDNFAGYGIAAVISWIILLDIYYKDSDQHKVPVVILLIAEFMLLSGIKAPMALVMLGAFLGTLILAAIMRKIKLLDFGLFIAFCIGIDSIYKLLLESNTGLTNSSSSLFSFASIDNICFWKAPLIEFLSSMNITGIPKISIITLVFLVSFFSIFFFPMCIGYIRELVLVISRKKDFDIPRIVIYAATLVGTILLLIMNYSGHSQIYFGIVAFSFSSIIAFWFFEEVNSNSSKWMQRLRNLCGVLLCITLIASTVSLGLYINKNIKIDIKRSNPNRAYRPYHSLNIDEIKAMEWLKENTPEDSLIATQMYASVPRKYYSVENRYQNTHFSYAVYSCRNFYLEGSGFSIDSSNVSLRKKMLAINDKLFDVKNNNRGNLADKLGVDYVVVTKYVDGPLKLENQDYVKCYTNDTIDIYEIK